MVSLVFETNSFCDNNAEYNFNLADGREVVALDGPAATATQNNELRNVQQDKIDTLALPKPLELSVEEISNIEPQAKHVNLQDEAEYTIYKAISDALTNNHQIKVASEMLLVSKADSAKAYLEFTPTLSIDYTASDYSPAHTSLYPKNKTESTSYTLTQELYSGGRTLHSISRAYLADESTKQQFNNVTENVILATISAYYNVILYRQLYAIQLKNEQSLNQYLEMVQTRFDYKDATITDVLRVQARLATASANKASYRNKTLAAEAYFEHIVGTRAPSILSPQILESTIPIPKTLEEFLKMVQLHNHAIITAEKSFNMAQKDFNIATSYVLPKISFQASSTVTSAPVGLNNSAGTTYALNVHIPIYQSGAEYAGIKKALHLVKKAKHTMLDTNAQAFEDAKNAWEERAQMEYIIASTTKAMEASKLAYESVLEEEKVRARTSLDVLDADIEMLSTQVQYYNAITANIVSTFKIYKEMGLLHCAIDAKYCKAKKLNISNIQ